MASKNWPLRGGRFNRDDRHTISVPLRGLYERLVKKRQRCTFHIGYLETYR